jgi:CRP-like cAMP-binding protein
MIRTNTELLEYIEELSNSTFEKYFTKQIFDNQQTLIYQGKRVSSVYIIKNGLAKCYLTEENGNEFIQEFFAEGEIFGEIEILQKDLSFCSIQAISDLTVYQIPGDDFQELLIKDQKFNQLILKSLASKIRYKAIRHAYNQTFPIEAKLLRLKEQFPELTQKISKADIANYLGITLRSLNRTINELKNTGRF